MIDQGKISGFYYDVQRENRMTSVTLHVNTNDKGEALTEGKEDSGEEFAYSIEPLCSSIVTEDFSVNLTNSWGTKSGMTAGIESTYDNLVSSNSAYIGTIASAMTTITKEVSDWISEKDTSKMEDGILKTTIETSKSVANYTNDIISKGESEVKRYANSKLRLQGTRFTYYNGTDFGFSGLGMRFTMFADYINGTWTTVKEQVEKLYPYILGPFEKVTEGDSTVENAVNTVAGWQRAPAGYESSMLDIDVVQKGTLKLKIGPYYYVDNLICSGAQFTFSRQMVKEPLTTGKVSVSPLYCEVNLTLQPAAKYTDEKLKAFIGGGEASNLEELNDELSKNLESIILTNHYGGGIGVEVEEGEEIDFSEFD